MNKCTARKKDGSRCTADPQAGREVCVFHDPEKIEDGHRARQKGGIRRNQSASVLPLGTRDHPLEKSSDTALLLADSINQLRRGELDPRVANAIGYLASIQLRAFEQSTMEKRITTVEIMMGLIAHPPFKLKEEEAKEQSDDKPHETA